MEIRRIKEIKNIGTFADFDTGASIQFEKLTFIHGFNTFGKTTISDIFHSLKTNESSIITKRKTIPKRHSNQKVNISIRENEASDGERDIIFDGAKWSKNTVSPFIEVFGTDFIHKNVFTGLTIQRNNKENLTNFILGDQGVQLAEEIKNKKQKLAEKKRDLKETVPQYVKNESSEGISSFVKLSVTDVPLREINLQIAKRKILLEKEEKRLEEPSRITNLPEPNLFEPKPLKLAENARALNTLLEKDYKDIKNESIERLESHISKNFAYSDHSKSWIQEGLRYCKDKQIGDCPFCGQGLESARNLIYLYDSYFNKSYTNFIEEISISLEINLNSFRDIPLNNRLILQEMLINFNQYKELLPDASTQEEIKKLELALQELKEAELKEIKDKIALIFEIQIEHKLKSPHEKFSPIDCTELIQRSKQYSQQLRAIESIIRSLLEKIHLLKQKYKNISAIKKTIKKYQEDILKLECTKARLEQNEDCIKYKAICNELESIENGENGIKKLEEKLQKNQTDFLERYFIKIDTLFSKFGSENFTLEKKEEKKGHMPVYSLRIKFHDEEIPIDQIGTVFSESDRRALALAIFFARIELKNPEETKKTVILLDDPITSFDDNRVTISINYFKETLSKCSQLIILTHYVSFIKRFCEITKKEQFTVKFLDIAQNEFTASLDLAERDEFACSQYEKTFMKIYNFINRKHNDSIKSDLRPFLEEMYLPVIFKKQLADDDSIDCSTLEKMINGLFKDNEEVREKFHEFRITLNPNSHIFTTNNPEDVRSFAKGMFDFIYSVKFQLIATS